MTLNARAQKSAQATLDSDIAVASIPVSELLTGDRRMEGESYLSEGYQIRKQVEASSLPVESFGNLAEVWLPSRLKGVQVSAEHGEPFLTATQVFDIRPRARKWLAPSRVNELTTRYIEPNQLLVTRSGSVGDVIVAHSAHEGFIISDDLLRVEPRELGYLYAFLRTRFGRAMVRSSKYGSIVKHLQPEHLQNVPVPLLSDDLRRITGERVSEVFRLREEALRRFLEAEVCYEREVGIPKDEPPSEMSYAVPASRLFGHQRRLDGYHYNPAAEQILRGLKDTKREIAPLHSVTAQVFGVPRFKHVYAESGIPYLDSEDLFKVNPEITKFIPQATKKNPDAYYVEKDWLLMACSGQIYGLNGNVVLANEWHESKIISNHVIRIVPSKADIRPGYLRMVLGHPTLGWPLVIRCAFGTSVPEIAPEDVLDLPIIRLEASVEEHIAELVESANRLRLRADREEDAVTALVESELGKVIGEHDTEVDETGTD